MTKNRVLIVEDEISIAKMINMNLKVANYDTVMFHDGDEAAKPSIPGSMISKSAIS